MFIRCVSQCSRFVIICDYKDNPNKLNAEIGNLGNVENSLLNYKQAENQRDFKQTSRLAISRNFTINYCLMNGS